MDWQEERDKAWADLELYDDANEPMKKKAHVTYTVSLSDKTNRSFKHTSHWNPILLYVSVAEGTEEIDIEPNSFWFSKDFGNLTHEEKMVVYSYLVEWEYAQWLEIGPEQSELFATKKLTSKEDTPVWEP